MSTLVLLPLFNEAATIRSVLHELRRHYAGAVLVVNDGSTDRSGDCLNEAADPELHVLTHEVNRGYGASLIAGFHYAVEHGFEAVTAMDCDFQHEPGQVPEFFERLSEVDVLSGSRYLRAADEGDAAPVDRLRINRLITERLNRLTALNITDAFCGFKAYRTAALKRLELDEAGYGFPLQFWLRAHRAGLRVGELPVARIYQNMDRSFGATLDDPAARLAYYEGIIERETALWR